MPKLFRGLFIFFILYTLYFILIPSVSAQFTITQPGNAGVPVGNKTGSELLQAIIGNVVTILFTIAGIGVLIMLLWGAIEWITSGGDKEKLTKARGRIVNAIIGLILIGVSFVIIRVVGQVIGFDPLGTLGIPSLSNSTPSVICDDSANVFCGPQSRCVPNANGQVINGRRFTCQ